MVCQGDRPETPKTVIVKRQVIARMESAASNNTARLSKTL
jgi:hypothetical protein